MSNVFLDLATLKALNLCASTDQTRYYLAGVYVEIDDEAVTYCATNGHILAARQLRAEHEGADRLTGRFIIPSRVIKSIKFGPRVKSAEVVIERIGEKHFGMAGAAFEMIDGTFPDWRRIVPTEPMTNSRVQTSTIGAEHVEYDPKYLVAMESVGLTIGAGRGQVIPNGTAPALVQYAEDSDLLAVITPMRVSAPRATILPAWFRPHAAPATP